MITLERKQPVQVIQVQAEIARKIKGSPFVAVLMYASELEAEDKYITPERLRDNLFRPLTTKACKNLLERLTVSGFFQLIKKSTYDDNYSEFKLTEFGLENAIDKSFWAPEIGVFDLYFTPSEFIPQALVKVKPVKRLDSKNATGNLDYNVKNEEIDSKLKDFLMSQIFSLGEEQIRITHIEKRIKKVGELNWRLSLEVSDTTLVKLINNKKYEFDLPIDNLFEGEVKPQILKAEFGNMYDESNDVVKTGYDPPELSLKRTITIDRPMLKEVTFDPIELPDVQHVPKSQEDADRWHRALLWRDIETYFFDDAAFAKYERTHAKEFAPWFQVERVTRQQLVPETCTSAEDFYKISKLTAADYLKIQSPTK